MKFVTYVRKSTEQEEKQTLSLESQLRELREFAATERLEIVRSGVAAGGACAPLEIRRRPRIPF